MASGGYNYEFCDSLPEDCPCPVCKRVQREPNQLICCGKLVCESCLDTLVCRKKCCPNCGVDLIKEKKFFPDTNAKRKIKSLRVWCQNKNNGCTWSGHLRDVDTHIPECPNEIVKCTNAKCTSSDLQCDQKVQRHLLQQHMSQKCKWRVVSCQYCGKKGTHHVITGEHVQVCRRVPLLCPHHGCEVKVQRLRMLSHQQTCPKGIIDCQYSQLGCTTKIKREDIQTHNQTTMGKHLELTSETLEMTTRTLAQTGRALENTIRDLETTKKDMRLALERIAVLEKKEQQRLFKF